MKFRGGARIDYFNATWPFATLDVGVDCIILKVLTSIYVFQKEEVQNLKRHGLFSRGIKIVHSNPTAPAHIVFWPFPSREVLEVAQKAGYPVAKGQVNPNKKELPRCFRWLFMPEACGL